MRKKTKLSTSKGFSLIELMAVIGIIGILMVLAIPNFANMQRQARIRSAAQEIAQDFRQIRERALSLGHSYQITFPDNRTYVVTRPDGSSTTYKLGSTTGGKVYFGGTGVSGSPPEGSMGAPGIGGIDFPGNVLTIDARGGATKGVIYVTDNHQNYAIGVNTLGKIKVYVYNGSGGWF